MLSEKIMFFAAAALHQLPNLTYFVVFIKQIAIYDRFFCCFFYLTDEVYNSHVVPTHRINVYQLSAVYL